MLCGDVVCDVVTDEQTLVVVESLLQLKTIKSNEIIIKNSRQTLIFPPKSLNFKQNTINFWNYTIISYRIV